MYTAEQLIAFEEHIAQVFNNKEIRAPIHLDNGNEDQLIRVFKKVRPEDWVCCTWRSHYKCLLKGVPPEQLKQAILDGRSIGLCFSEYKVVSSGIVGGIIPIALGLAKASKLKNSGEHVHCFVGEMSAMTGILYECQTYAVNFDLPITFIVEDNGKSVCTPTYETWGVKEPFKGSYVDCPEEKMIYFRYQSKWPHAGGGKRINF